MRRSLKIEPMNTVLKFLNMDDSILLSNSKDKSLQFIGRINELFLIFQEIMLHSAELDRSDSDQGFRINPTECECLEIEKYKDYIDNDIDESFDSQPYITYVFKYEVDEEGKNIENSKKEEFNIGLTIRKAIKDRVFKMKVLTIEQQISCINKALEEIELYLQSDPFQELPRTQIAARQWCNYLRAQAVSLANNFEGDIPFPTPPNWTPEKIILDAETFEIASCIYKILSVNGVLYNVNIFTLAMVISRKFYLTNNRRPNPDSIRLNLGDIKKGRMPKLPVNQNEIIAKLNPEVQKFIDAVKGSEQF